MFATYISSVGDAIRSHGMRHHQYADDTQLFINGKPCSLINDIAQIVSVCTNAVRTWFLHNDLLLNADKSDVMLIETRQQLLNSKLDNSFDIAGCSLDAKDGIKISGVTIKSELNLRNHANFLCRTCNYHIRALKHIRG